MTDPRFDKLYILKIEDGEIDRLRRVCEDYRISDNGAFENAASFHRIWGFAKMDSFICLMEWLKEDLTLTQLMSLKNF